MSFSKPTDLSTVTTLQTKLDQSIREVYPGYPALVMATGIISNAFYFMGLFRFSQLLLIANLIALPLGMYSVAMFPGFHRLPNSHFCKALAADLSGSRQQCGS